VQLARATHSPEPRAPWSRGSVQPAVAGQWIFPPTLFRGQRVIHWIDNLSAVAGLCKGYSRVHDSVRLVHAFHAFANGLGARVWFEYVPTKANVSDAPSREDLSGRFYPFEFVELPGVGSWDAGLTLPNERRWDDEASSWCRSGERM